MEWISNWIQGIIVAVIIGTIIEMILPEGNCKKYIKVVIGVYILFSIISPVITKFTGSNLKLTNIFDLNEYMQASSSEHQNLEESQEEQIRSIYESNLKNDIKEKLKSKGYETTSISLEIENSNQYTIKSMNITLKKEKTSDTSTNKMQPSNKIEVQDVDEIEIQVGNKKENNKSENNNKEQSNSNKNEALSSKEQKELKQYLSGVYEIEEKNININ